LETGIRGPYVAPSLFRSDPGFLDCGGWTPLWIFPSAGALFPSQAPSSRSTPRPPHGNKASLVTAELYPNPSRLRVRLFSPPVKTLELWD
jgi:hypothetical protein